MTVGRSNQSNIQILKSYKDELSRAARKASYEADERISMTTILYRLITDHLEDVTDKIIKEKRNNP
jgi:hypothetical protein